MTVKANVLAYTTVFHVSGVFLLVGAITALFVKEAKVKGVARENVVVEM
jgi:hypothetical protein